MDAGHLVLVVPCYNEARRLDRRGVLECLNEVDHLRFLFVDDGSRDETRSILSELQTASPGRVDLCALPVNRGKAEAVRTGVLEAFGRHPALIGYWDADLSTPLTELPAFLRLFAEHPDLEIVLGSRVRLMGRHVERRATRHYIGRAFATASSLILGLPIYDTQCGAKVFRASPLVRRVFERPFKTRWVFDVEILLRYTKLIAAQGPALAHTRIRELPLHVWRDVSGSKLGPVDAARVAWELCQLIHERRSGGV